MLGARRFTIVPLPESFDAALRILEEARAREQLYEAALLDLERAGNEARQARPRSLALQVETVEAGLRAYIDSILGDIRAQRSQIEALESELESIRERLLELQPQSRMIEAQVTMLRRAYELGKLRQRFDAPLDASDLRKLAYEIRSELQSLDLGGIAALQEEVVRLQLLVAAEEVAKERISRHLTELEIELRSLGEQKLAAMREYGEAGQQADETRARYPRAIIPAEELLDERRSVLGKLTRSILNALIDQYERPGRRQVVRVLSDITI